MATRCLDFSRLAQKIHTQPRFIFCSPEFTKIGREKSNFIAYFYTFYPKFRQNRVKFGPKLVSVLKLQNLRLCFCLSPEKYFRHGGYPVRVFTYRTRFTCTEQIQNNHPRGGVTTYRNGPTKIPKRTSMGTETDRNRLQWVPKRTGTDCRSYRNELQWEPEKVGWGTIGTSLIKLCMYW